MSLNRYTYASNNPIRYWDPSGFCSEGLGIGDIAGICTPLVIDETVRAIGNPSGPKQQDFDPTVGLEEQESIRVRTAEQASHSAILEIFRSFDDFGTLSSSGGGGFGDSPETLAFQGSSSGSTSKRKLRLPAADYEPLTSGLSPVTVDHIGDLAPVVDRWSSHFGVPAESVSLVLEWEGRHLFEGINKPVIEEMICVQNIYICEGALGTKSLGIGSIQTTLGASLYQSVLRQPSPPLSQLAIELHIDYELNVIFTAAHIAQNRALIDPTQQGVFTDFMAYAYDAGAIKINNAAGWTVPGLVGLGLTPGNFSDRLSAYDALVGTGP